MDEIEETNSKDIVLNEEEELTDSDEECDEQLHSDIEEANNGTPIYNVKRKFKFLSKFFAFSLKIFLLIKSLSIYYNINII